MSSSPVTLTAQSSTASRFSVSLRFIATLVHRLTRSQELTLISTVTPMTHIYSGSRRVQNAPIVEAITEKCCSLDSLQLSIIRTNSMLAHGHPVS